MGEAQAQSYIDNGARAQFEIWGDDPIYDNRLIQLRDLQLFVSRNGDGLIVQAVLPVDCSVLDEDVFFPPYNGGEDEIYGKVIFDAPGGGPGGGRLTARTNTWNGYHGFGEGPIFS